MNRFGFRLVYVGAGSLVAASVAAAPMEKKDGHDHGTLSYQSKELTFQYPEGFGVARAKRGTVIRVIPQSEAPYWEDVITIRKHNKKTEECDLPQDCQPESSDNRKIAGRAAYAYSCQDAAMNRYVRRKGYFIEDKQSCWNLELIRTGRPYEKLDLSVNELNRLNRQSEIDSKRAKLAFETVLKTFALVAR